MITSQGQVIMLMVVLAAGFIIGAALAWWLAGRGNTPPADQEQEILKELRKRYTEKAALWQDRSTGQLAVRSGGLLITSSRQMTDAQKRSMNTLLKDWAGWMGFTGSQTETHAAPAEPPAPAAAVSPAPVKSSALPPTVIEESAEVKAAALEKPKSIVEQIDDILQEILKSHPAMNKGIRLSEDPRQGVVVWIGLEHFAGVDAVTDLEVKEILKQAVREWEKRTQPGKK